MGININWHNIRPINDDLREGFEEFVAQLARKETIPNGKYFIRKGRPDAGIECYWKLEDDAEWAWQAKYFTSSLGSTQWKQINESVTTAIQNHKKITKYFIAIPIDPPDAEKGKKISMLDKWEEYKQKWSELAQKQGMMIDFIAWWHSDLISRLQRRENAGLTLFWFDKESFTDEWFENKRKKSIADLGKRYTPELNFELPVVKFFDGLARDDNFYRQLNTKIDAFSTSVSNIPVLHGNTEITANISKLKEYTQKLVEYFVKQRDIAAEYYDFDYVDSLCKLIEGQLSCLNEKIIENKDVLNENGAFDKIISRIEYSFTSFFTFKKFLSSKTAKLYNNPFLFLDGEAGIGKSHLLGDITNRRNQENKHTLLLLGQQFNTSENPEKQILSNLDLQYSFEELLEALSCQAQISKSRILIFFDAINEGKGKEFWPNFFNGFFENVSKYKWLGFVFTIRTSYLGMIQDNIEKYKNKIVRYTHSGFTSHEYNAAKMFFKHYGFEQPNNPILHHEFHNPLFLKLFCESLHRENLKNIPGNLQGISAFILFFIHSVNTLMARPQNFDYSSGKNLAMAAVNSIVKYMIENTVREVPFDTAFDMVENSVNKYITKKGKFLDELISEGVFTKNMHHGSMTEYIYFTYERFADHLICKRLLDNCSDLNKAFDDNGEIFNYLNGQDLHFQNHGILEALAIQMPENYEKEIFECFETSDIPFIKESFIESLVWRKINIFQQSTLDYIYNNILNDSYYFSVFFEKIISISTVANHSLNALFLHKYLMGFTLPERDAIWTDFLRYKYDEDTPIKRLVDWAWENDDKSSVSDGTLKLASMTLAWFLCSTDRELRDMSTKGIILLLKNRIPVLVNVLKSFENVNDPYIYERLFAVSYGCVLHTKQKDKLGELAEYVYSTIFKDKTEVFPHILLRDYARNCIEYTRYLNIRLSFDIICVRPPYKSAFKIKAVSNEEIDRKYKNTDGHESHGQNKIIASMTTEYGRGMCRYGDFGRYIFQYLFDEWDINIDNLSNMAIELIFEKYGYEEKLHGQYDTTISYIAHIGRKAQRVERIGKKYQWLALHELLARVSDNCKKQNRWSPENVIPPYEGTWEPFVRDIDPSLLITQTSTDDDTLSAYWWKSKHEINFNCSDDDFLFNTGDISDFSTMIQVIDENNDYWLTLQSYPEWAEKKQTGTVMQDKSYKNVWAQIRSYLCRKSDFKKIIDWANKQNFMGRWMPENPDKYVLFSREYYWSPGYKYCMDQDEQGNAVSNWENSYRGRMGDIIAPIIVSTEEYTWEKEYDNSIKETISILKPRKFIYERMDMRHGDDEGDFVDADNRLLCFDTSVKYNSKQSLLIKKEPFINFLNKNNLEVFWTVLGEKQIIAGNFDSYHGMLEYSGVYYFRDKKLKGKITTNKK